MNSTPGNIPLAMIFHPAGQFNPVSQQLSVLQPPQTFFLKCQLQPYTVYSFRVVAENSLGKTQSQFSQGRTAEDGKLSVCNSENSKNIEDVKYSYRERFDLIRPR